MLTECMTCSRRTTSSSSSQNSRSQNNGTANVVVCSSSHRYSQHSSWQCQARSVTWYAWLLLAMLACCSIAASACPQHGSEPAAKCGAPAPAPKAAAVAAAAAAEEEPISIVYEEVSEADLVAAAHQRQLLGVQAPKKKGGKKAAMQEDEQEEEEAEEVDSTVQRPVRRCGARPLSAEEASQVSLHLAHHKARQAVHQRARLSSMSTASAASATQRTSLNIPLYFHVITGKTRNSTVDAPQELLLKQLQAMNDAYGRYSIKFDLRGITRVQSESWAIAEINSPEETLMKSKLRKGGLGDLNIYVIRPASGTLGWSTFPWEAIKLGESFDGVLVHVGTMPGGNMKPYNKGYTMVHEVGHWLGLLHVFENGCDTPGDSVEDTPPQASAAYGCPITRHTCSNSPATDPVTNYMGYTDDSCMTAFTRGQANRVLAMWDIYRAPTAQQSIVAEKSLIKSNSWQQQQQQEASEKQQQTLKQQQQGPKQQLGGVALLEQGAVPHLQQGLPGAQQLPSTRQDLIQQQVPEAVQYIAAPAPVDPAAAFAAKQAAGQAPSYALDRKVPSKQQRSAPSPTGAAWPHWGNLLSGSPLVSFNTPDAVLEANAQVKKAQEEQQQQQQQQQKHRHKSRKSNKNTGWSSWLTTRPAPAAATGALPTPVTAYSAVEPLSYQQLQPEMGQYTTGVNEAAPGAAPAPTLHAWSQPQPQQQYQYQYVQQMQVYQHHTYPQAEAMLPPGFTGPLGPQYLMGAGPALGSSAATSQAALLAAMGSTPGFAPVPVYDPEAAAAAAAALPPANPSPPERHGKGRSKKKKGKKGG